MKASEMEGLPGFMVGAVAMMASDRQPGIYYKVRMNEHGVAEWCSCPHFAKGGRKGIVRERGCKHCDRADELKRFMVALDAVGQKHGHDVTVARYRQAVRDQRGGEDRVLEVMMKVIHYAHEIDIAKLARQMAMTGTEG